MGRGLPPAGLQVALDLGGVAEAAGGFNRHGEHLARMREGGAPA
jgi:hypothetical protein